MVPQPRRERRPISAPRRWVRGRRDQQADERPDQAPCNGWPVAGIQPELWVDRAREAVAFYVKAFGARLLHRVGDGDDIVAQLAVEGSAFWVAAAGPDMGRFSPRAIGGATGRTLLVTDDPEAMVRRAVEAGATELSPVGDEHGWCIGRIRDPYGHEWEIGKPIGDWPPR